MDNMDNNNIETHTTNSTAASIGEYVWRFVASVIILAITAFFTPGFTINSIWSLVIAAIVLSLIDYMLAVFTGLNVSNLGKGIVGFVLAAAALYLTQYFVAGYTISWMAAIIGALVYGVVDFFIPGNQQS